MRAWQNGLDLRMVIHDELIFMVPKDDVVRMVRIIGDMMKVIEGFEFPVEVLAAHENYAAKRALEAPKGE
jgi:DNA polymerase I-like protein with 3'-5' exonuclease and polymerase domains